MATYRAGFHVNGTGGHRGALGEYIAQLTANGHRPVINAVDDAALAVDVANADGIAVYRKTQWSAAPDYNLSPQEAAQVRWHGIKALIPPEIEAVKDKVVIEVTNEPDRARADWLGRFMLRISELGNADGYTIGGPSFAAGNPEISDWETPGMLAYLDYVGMHADLNVVCLHEYSLDSADITTGSPWLVGRYQFMFDVCEAYDLIKPPVIITELGWSYRTMPSSGVMEQIAWAAELYGNTPVCWWTLGSGLQWGDLPQKLSAYVDDVTAWILANSEPEPEPEPPPPPPEPVNPIRELWDKSLDYEKATGINFNPKFAFIKWAADNGYSPVHSERAMLTSDGAKWNAQAFKDLRGNKPRVMAFYEQPWEGMGKVKFVTEADLEPEPEPQPFSFSVWPTDHKTITQIVGNNPAYYGRLSPHFDGHEGADIRAPLRSPVYAVFDGVVSDLRQAGDAGHAYGRFVRVQHAGGYETTYAHLDSIGVSLGQQVSAGQEVGRADNTGNIVSGASHLHLTLKKDGVIIDPTPYLLPHRPNFPGLPPAAHGLTVCDVSQHQGAIDWHKMMRRGVYGVYIRGSIGASGLDTRFAANWQGIQGTPILRGMYHLWRSDATAEQNLTNIIKTMDKHGAGDLRVAIDIEPVTGLPRINGDEVARFLPMFRDAFGYEPLVYTGLWVIDRVDGNRTWFASSLLWLASYWQNPPQVGQFPQLPSGGQLSRLLAHQWTSSYFDGRAWGASSIGLDVNVVYDLNLLTVVGKEPEPPPPAPTVDMARYFLPPGGAQYGDIVILKNNWGAGDERQQLQRQGSYSFVTKNQQFERRLIDDNVIRLELDTSPGNNEYYTVKSSTGWMPRDWWPGATFTRSETADFFRKGDCRHTGRTLSGSSDLKFAKLHNVFTTRGGITFHNVAEVHWIRSGVVEERYYYAPGYGLISWWNRGGRESWATEVIPVGQQGNNVMEQGCFS